MYIEFRSPGVTVSLGTSSRRFGVMKTSNCDFAPKSSLRLAIDWPMEHHVAPSSCANMKLSEDVYECRRSIEDGKNGCLAPNSHYPLPQTSSRRPNPASQPSNILPTRPSSSCVCAFRIPLAVDGTFEGVSRSVDRRRCQVVVGPCRRFRRYPT
jgi:hypothetical protein